MKTANAARRLAATSVLLGLTACAGTGVRLQSPSVALVSVEAGNLDIARQTFLLGFAVDNPNPFPLPVRSVRYQVSLDDQRFAGGETVGSFTIPAEGAGEFTISVDLDLLRSGAQITSIVRNAVHQSIDYELAGSLAVDIPFVQPIRFSDRGTIMVQSR